MACFGTAERYRVSGLIGLALVVSPGMARAGQDRPERGWIDAARRPGAPPGAVRRDLPHARGREFRTLDAYLAYLKAYAAPIDRPWYRQIGPGLYKLETGNLRSDAPPRLFTRDQLERRFGFRD
jgi:hypothetical protein